MSPDSRRSIPQVEVLVSKAAPMTSLPRPVVVAAVRTVTSDLRKRLRRGLQVPTVDAIHSLVAEQILFVERQQLLDVINATGVIVHTNLGRAPMAASAIAAVAEVARGYTNLEFDLTTGKRGDRHQHAEPALAIATGAQAAVVVNNGAAAVLLMCAAIASARQIVVSRGELVEIGGSFRIPDVIAQSNAVLTEVGTTNRTHLRDYERAVTPETAAILKVHPSNYRVVGFTNTVPATDLARLAHAHRLVFMYDAGSGLLNDQLTEEPVIGDLLSAGADLVAFSGDKLLGGPQAGIVVGRKALVQKLRAHPLMRALRPDKMTLAALQETVSLHLQNRLDEIPVWAMLRAKPEDLERRCKSVARSAGKAGYKFQVIESPSVVGGGSMPESTIATPVLRVTHESMTPGELSSRLRACNPAVVVRVAARGVLIDLRTVEASDDARIVEALRTAATS